MFKKVKRYNGIREIYLGKIKLFKYVNSVKFAEFVEAKFNQAFAKHDIDIIYDISMGGGTPLLTRI